jgi:hypothetical protein
MDRLNPTAVIFWAMMSLGFHLAGWGWALGLFIGLCVSVLVSMFGD